MEQWQFLIQKEGERTWHPLEKPNVEITEGRYRVVARSNRTNTDVEVRVTHSSPSEVPPIRRIQKRIRRVNSEGLTAIIPFTYLKSGTWELQCSGDLMSDLLGASWQYTVNLAVIPFPIEGKIISPTKPNHNFDKQYEVAREDIQTNQTNLVKSKIKDTQSSRYPVSSKDFKTNDAGLISSISIETSANIGSNSSITGKLTSTPPNTGKKAVSDQEKGEKPADKLRESLRVAADKQKAVTKKLPQKSTSKVSTTQNKVVSEIPTQKLAEKAKGLPEIAVNASPAEKQTASIVTSNKPVNKKPFPESLESNTATSNQKDVREKTVKKSAQKPKTSNQKDVNKKPLRKEVTAIAKQNSNPVRIKGDTAEQILQNLMELALPSSEPLLADDSIENALTAPPLPLLITLDKDSHVASWGSTITLEGVIQLKETTHPQIKQITSAEVEIELRSPQNSQLLQSFRLPNPNKSLPFAIASLINIPEECPSKLILGEVKLYGALLQSGVVELLASQSFTITAEIKELLAITVANPKGELEKFACSTEEYFAQNAPQILEESASLDLKLFNLVKTRLPEQQSVTRVKSTKKSLPPRIDPRKLRRRVATHPLKLPNVPGYQEKIHEYINNGYIENFSVSAITGTSFPFLRKSKAIPSRLVEVDEDVDRDEESTYTNATESQEIAESFPVNNTQAELVVDPQKEDYIEELEEPVTPRNSELIAGENYYTSPLIRQWMLSQGYSVPEPIDVEYEDYDIEVRQQISYQQVSLSPNPQDDNSQVLQPEETQIDIQATPSPYISISTSSQWQVNQITAPSTQIAQEIVLDDTDIFADDILNAENSQPDAAADDKTENSSSSALTISTQKLEYLPIPELYVQQGELISGKSLSVRVRLPEGNSHLAVKLWLEDCQTRHLLDSPHLLTNLTPNKNQQLEIITKLNVPFGCLEIRLEAVAINRSTQQESHKFTIQRTVIPPDLPGVQLDAMLGM